MVNDLGVDPYEWFDNPLDRMPIATDTPLSTNRYAPPEKMIELEENPRPEEEVADDWFESDTYASRHKSTPDHEKSAEEVVTMHEKMYRIATAKYNPFSIGGSENIQDFDERLGGSENVQRN